MAILTSIIIPVLSLVAVFLFAIEKFSNHIRRVADGGFKKVLRKITNKPLSGLGVGAVFTSLIQSSTATTVILAGLVNAEIITFYHSLGVIFGANIGTTITSQLIALKVTNLAPYFILLGFVLTYFGRKYKSWGKPVFYFGLVFFSLSLISLYIEPVRHNPEIIALFANISSLFVAVLVGFLFTAIVQSSTVTSGLVVVLAGSGLLDIHQAFGIILGSNLGTTITVALASLPLGREAKRVAAAHILFNVLGILILLPFFNSFVSFSSSFSNNLQQQVAAAHIFFNIIFAFVFLIFVKPFYHLVRNIVK